MTTIEDDLTGLRNRRSFLSILRRCVVHAVDKHENMALLVVDIDGFAQINGAYGYEIGDEVLVHLKDQLKRVARVVDYVARIGDNRFALILRGVMNAGHSELAVQKLFRLLEVPFQSTVAKLKVSVTVGAALCPAHASQAEFLLRRAEGAIRRARLGGLRHAFAPDTSTELDLSELWDLELQLAGAIERGELMMHYQPQVRLSDLRRLGAEALMRWKSPSRGMVGPNIFIPVAERTGQIKKLTLWALNTALRQASAWPACGYPLSVSVNLPGSLASQHDLPELVAAALNLWKSEHVQLVLEITESSLMDTTNAFPVLARIRELGVQISIDDFGTGYSCLAYFKNIPADELKVDRSFVSSLLTDSNSADITQLIVDLAHRFGLRVAAEGVEDEMTLHTLKRIGCDVAQGYLFGKPMAASELHRWLLSEAVALAD